MAFPTVPNSFVCQTTGLATLVNSNFGALFSAVGDGTSDLIIGRLTVDGATSATSFVQFNGALYLNASATLGDASSDVLSFYTTITPTSSAGASLGTSALKWGQVHLAGTLEPSSWPSSASGTSIASAADNYSMVTNTWYGSMIPRAWATVGSVGTRLAGFNVSATSRSSTGNYDIRFHVAMTTTAYVSVMSPIYSTATDVNCYVDTRQVQSCVIQIDESFGTAEDRSFSIAFFGG